MRQQELLDATSSEQLTLEEEYSNQVSWRKSHDKLTFIVCKPINRTLDGTIYAIPFLRMNTFDRIEHMVGDVNFFLHPYTNEGDDDQSGPPAGEPGWLAGEVDIMIADEESRNSGMGRAAVAALLVYVQVQMGYILEEYVTNGPDGLSSASLKVLFARIKEKNEGSRKLFESLGFKQEGKVNYFGEVKLVLNVADVQQQPWWEQALSDWGQIAYGSLRDEMKYT